MNSEEIMDAGRNKERDKYYVLKNILDYEVENNLVKLSLLEGEVYIQFLSPHIFRVVMGKRGKIDMKTSPAVIEHNQVYTGFTIAEEEGYIKIVTDSLKILINMEKFALKIFNEEGTLINEDYSKWALGWKGKEVRAWKKIKNGERFYGLGEKTGFLDKSGKSYTMWNTDVFEPHVDSTDPLYKSIPFLIGFDHGETYGIYFDNTYKTNFDLGSRGKEYYSFSSEGGKMDYYFIYGPSLKEVVSRFSSLTGRMPLPPKWSLGYHQSRYSYHPEEEVRKVANTLREKEIPCDAIHLDIHYMDEYRVFTWNEQEFPHPEKMISDLSDSGFKLVTIIDPGVKKDPEYNVYVEGMKEDYFCKYLDGEIYTGKVWPGESVFPDFTRKEVREWWGDLHHSLLDIGVKGIWNDMNEPAVFNETSTMDVNVIHENDGYPGTHRQFHNLYGFYEGMATYEGLKRISKERPFVLSRAGFAGIQRYCALWTGDNRSFWEHLKLAMPMLMNLGLSGISFAGTDIGGFTGDSNGELLTRWFQMGTFMPFFRNHCSIDGINQEPWSFGKEFEEIIIKYIKLRYKLLPHIYNQFYMASKKGLPVLRPLVMEFPDDETTYNISDQFMFGDSIMVAPVYEPDRKERLVYLPGGEWFDLWTDNKYSGYTHIIADAPLSKVPVYIKAGSILPLVDSMNYVGEKRNEKLNLNVYLGDEVEEGSYIFYEDDGLTFDYKDGRFNLTEFSYKKNRGQFIFKAKELNKGYSSEYKNIELKLKNLIYKPEQVMVEGEKRSDFDYSIDRRELIINIPAVTGKVIVSYNE